MKEKLADSLGKIGVILYMVIRLFASVFPFVMIGKSLLVDIIFFTIVQFFPPAMIVFWIWGLICAIRGVQDIFAIIYYILFVIIFIPFFISVVLDFVNASKK